MLAPPAIATPNTWQAKSKSARDASSPENSISSTFPLASSRIVLTLSKTSWRVIFNLYCICSSEIAINTCKRLRSAYFKASMALITSFSLQRARAQIVVPFTSRAMVATASKSPGEAAGKPASITSIPSRTKPFAISIFSGVWRATPGVCSPSRRVVSKK